MAQVRIELGAGEKGERRKEALKKLAFEAGFEYRGVGSIGKYICAIADGELGKQTLSERTWVLDLAEKVAELEPGWLQVVVIDECYGSVMMAKNVMMYVDKDDEGEGSTLEAETEKVDDEDNDGDEYGPEKEEKEEEKLKIYTEEEKALNWRENMFRKVLDREYGEGRGPLSR